MELQIEIWKAFMAETIGLKERQQILELCSAMFEPVDEFLMTFNYPKRWKAARATSAAVNGKPAASGKKKQVLIQFTSYYKTTPKTKFVIPNPPLDPPPLPEIKPPEPKKIKISRPSIAGPQPMAPHRLPRHLLGGPASPWSMGRLHRQPLFLLFHLLQLLLPPLPCPLLLLSRIRSPSNLSEPG